MNPEEIATHLAATRRMMARIEAGDALTLLVGSGATASAIELSPGYVETLRGDVMGGLRHREAWLLAALENRQVMG